MKHTALQLDGFIDLLVEAVLRDIEQDRINEDADESGQEQRRRGDQTSETVPLPNRLHAP